MANAITDVEFFNMGLTVAGFGGARDRTKDNMRYRAWFGHGPLITAMVWEDLVSGENPPVPENKANPTHFLWGLHFLKAYPTEAVHAGTFRTREENVSVKSWYFVGKIADLAAQKVRNSSLGFTLLH